MKSLLFIIIQIIVKSIISSSQRCQITSGSEYGRFLNYSAYKKLPSKEISSCFEYCLLDEICGSINFDFIQFICELIRVTKAGFPNLVVEQYGWIHAETRQPEYGSSKYVALPSCKRIHELRPNAPSGIYWIRLGYGIAQTAPFQVYCDMKTDEGGWTLVYSYRFTKFGSFTSVSNDITPSPNWPTTPTVRVSTKVPLSETSYEAMNFTLWKEIGKEFLIKPNITHWFSCVPGTGDLVNWKTGIITCKIVKVIAKTCYNVVPKRLAFGSCGAKFYSGTPSSSTFYMFLESNSNICRPIHDPCGRRSWSYFLTNVANPGGAVYVR